MCSPVYRETYPSFISSVTKVEKVILTPTVTFVLINSCKKQTGGKGHTKWNTECLNLMPFFFVFYEYNEILLEIISVNLMTLTCTARNY